MGPGISAQDLEFIQELAYVTGLRGMDSTGVLQGRAYATYRTHRVVKSEHDIGYFKWFHSYGEGGDRELLSSVVDNFIAVHVRAATIGATTAENAHPFEFNNLVGMHNGTLKDAKYLNNGTKTDSESLFADISERGLEVVLPELDKRSAYAIIMYSKVDGTFSFVRNEHRTIYVAYNKDRSVMYWSSEHGMLDFVAKRVGLNIGSICYLEKDIIHTFSPYQIKKGSFSFLRRHELFPKEKVEEVEEKPSNLRILRDRPKNRVSMPKVRIKDPLGKIPHTVCIKCQSPMNLYEMYKGTEIRKGQYSCNDCDEFDKELLEGFDEREQVIIH